MPWYTEGAKSSPSSGTVLADTGPQTSGYRTIGILCDSSVSGVVILEHRNADNDTTLSSQRISMTINSPFSFNVPYTTLILATDERIRVITSGAILGAVQASIFSDS